MPRDRRRIVPRVPLSCRAGRITFCSSRPYWHEFRTPLKLQVRIRAGSIRKSLIPRIKTAQRCELTFRIEQRRNAKFRTIRTA